METGIRLASGCYIGEMPGMTKPHFETSVLHTGTTSAFVGEPVSPSIVTATSFYTSPDAIGFSAADLSDVSPPFYSRWGNPTASLLEERLSQLEGGVGAVTFASGMAAVAALFLSRLSAGDHLVLSDICYAGVAEFAHGILPRYGISVTGVDTSCLESVAAAIRPGFTRLLHIETPSNPILGLSDIQELASVAHAAGIELSVDSTIATPIATQPLALGADYVLHSLTKYICGHGDALGGVIVARDSHRLADLRQGALIHHGAALSPFAAWLILRGLETLPVRMRVHEENARELAKFLEKHSAVRTVHWPGLDSHPQAALARRQMANFSGLLSFTTTGDGMTLARRVAERLRVFSYAVSIGKTRSLLYYIPTEDILRTSFRLDAPRTAAYRAAAGDGVFRVSAGLENSADLIEDLEAAMGEP